MAGYLPYQDFPSPRLCCLAKAGPFLNLCYCRSLWDLHGSCTAVAQQLHCFCPWWWVIWYGPAASAPFKGCLLFPSLRRREQPVWLGAALAKTSWAKELNWHSGAVQWVLMAQGWCLTGQSRKETLVQQCQILPKGFLAQGSEAIPNTLFLALWGSCS